MLQTAIRCRIVAKWFVGKIATPASQEVLYCAVGLFVNLPLRAKKYYKMSSYLYPTVLALEGTWCTWHLKMITWHTWCTLWCFWCQFWSRCVSYRLWVLKLSFLFCSFTQQICFKWFIFTSKHCAVSNHPTAGWTFTKLSLPWQVLNDHLPTPSPDPDIPDWLVIAPQQPALPGPS